MPAAIDELVQFLTLFRAPSPRPILWVGAGASAAAGYPTLQELEEELRAHLSGNAATGLELADAYATAWAPAALDNLLETHLGAPRRFTGLHASMARLTGAGFFDAIFTTNYDELIEDALKAASIHHVPHVLEANARKNRS